MTKERLEQFYRDFSTKGYEYGALNYFTEDVVYENPGGLEYSGRDNVINYMKGVHRGEAIKETITPVRLLITGDVAAAELIIQLDATVDVPDHNITPLKKGDRVAHRVSAWYTFRGNRVARLKIYPPAALTPKRM
ncbi:MAG TPA: nuclear transport factor 2 family protein [Syntrophorhabdaceae bacterium]|nr:nuclear transport factor 2 family protein [Syntrophorhabdaceae bacterium]